MQFTQKNNIWVQFLCASLYKLRFKGAFKNSNLGLINNILVLFCATLIFFAIKVQNVNLSAKYAKKGFGCNIGANFC